MTKLRDLINGKDLIVAPVALNPIMARLARDAGFKATYLSGGSLGWYKCVTEANITMPEIASVCLDIRAACNLPIIVDAGGVGDPMHIHRAIQLMEATGIQGIEIEDQIMPRRVEHHLAIEHLVSTEMMLDRIKEAISARTNPDLVIIARTNSIRIPDLEIDEVLRRGEAFKKAGADAIFIWTNKPEELRMIGNRIPGPLMMFAPPDGFDGFEMTPAELAELGYRIAASPGAAFAAMYKAAKQSYECLAKGVINPYMERGGVRANMLEAHKTCDLEKLVEIERRTMKD